MCIMKVPFGKEFVDKKYKNYVRWCLLGRDCVNFDRVSNDIYNVATSKGSRKELNKETILQSGNICGKIVCDMLVNKYIDRSIHEKMRKWPHELLTLGRDVVKKNRKQIKKDVPDQLCVIHKYLDKSSSEVKYCVAKYNSKSKAQVLRYASTFITWSF